MSFMDQVTLVVTTSNEEPNFSPDSRARVCSRIRAAYTPIRRTSLCETHLYALKMGRRAVAP